MQIADVFYQKILELERDAQNIEHEISSAKSNSGSVKERETKAHNAVLASLERNYRHKTNSILSNFMEQKDDIEKELLKIDDYVKRVPTQIRSLAGTITAKKETAPNYLKLDEFYPLLTDPTFWAKVKRLVGWGGYYSQKDMVADYMQILADGKKYFNKKLLELEAVKDTKLTTEKNNYNKEVQKANKDFQNIAAQEKNKLDILKNRLKQEYQKFLALPTYEQLKKRLILGLEQSWYNPNSWQHFTPSGRMPKNVIIGQIKANSNISSEFKTEFEKRLNPLMIKDSYYLPVSVDLDRPVKVHITCNSETRQEAIYGVQSLIMKILREAPTNAYSVTFIDPKDRGSNIGRLRLLTKAEGCRLINKPAASETDIVEQLKAIEHQVDEMSLKLTDLQTIYEYNKSHSMKLMYNIIVINDLEYVIKNSAAIETLKVLLHNANKCGISIVICSESNNNELDIHDFTQIAANDKIFYIECHENCLKGRYPFKFDTSGKISDQYIKEMRDEYCKKIVLDNSFKRLYNLQDKIEFKDVTNGLTIPFAIDEYNNIINIEIGGALTSYTMLTGTAGSGKSTTLHGLIAGIIMNYHPDDVELWLVDYKKVEFSEYTKNIPPQVKLIGLDRSDEFSYSIIDKLDEIFQERMNLFHSVHVQDFIGYRNLEDDKKPIKRMPRILLVIDEFHNFSNALLQDDDMKVRFETAMLEYRALGLSCIFADQAIGDGLRGLTPKCRKQINNRIAMKNNLDEVRETIDADNMYFTDDLKMKISTLSKGELIFKRQIVENGQTEIVIDKYTSIFVSADDRDKLIPVVQDNVSSTKCLSDSVEVNIIDGRKRAGFDPSYIAKFEKTHPLKNMDEIPLYCGTPSTLDPCFRFCLQHKNTENILIASEDDDMRMSVLSFIMKSYIRSRDKKIFVCADEIDSTYSMYKDMWETIETNSNIEVIKDKSKICRIIYKMRSCIADQKTEDVMCVFIGIDGLFDDFETFKTKQQLETEIMNYVESKNTVTDSNVHIESDASEPLDEADISDELANIQAMLNQFSSKQSSNVLPQEYKREDVNVNLSELDDAFDFRYNAKEDIATIIRIGGKKKYHFVVTCESVRTFMSLRSIKVEDFRHKIGTKMTDDDSYDLVRTKACSSLDDITAIYNSGSVNSNKIFRPYIL